MANTYFDTGHGATIVFADNTYAFNWTSIDLGSQSTPSVDITNLASTSREKMSGDLVDAGSATVNFIFDQGVALPAFNDSETVTITLPSGSAGTAATYAGNAFVESIDLPSLETDGLQEGSLSITWTAKPTFTAGS